ncbi:MAG TPA: hypothetical protein VGK47_10800 [Nitrososphaeraceae archaeon]
MSYGNNTNAPNGFVPYSYMDGSLWTGQLEEYPIASGYGTCLFEGDPVTLLADGTIGIGVAGSGIIGIFQGVTYTSSTGEPIFTNFWTASTATQGSQNALAKVVADPNVLFDVQVASSSGGTVNPVAIAQTDINNNANFAVAATSYNPTSAPNAVTYAANPGSGNTTTGISGYYLAHNTLNTTATLSLKLIRLTPKVGNVFSSGGTASGTINFNNVLVLINNHTLKGGTGTAGV